MEISYRNSYLDSIGFAFYLLPRRRFYQICIGISLLFVSKVAFDVVSQLERPVQVKILAFCMFFFLGAGFLLVMSAIFLLLSAATTYFSSRENQQAQTVIATEDGITFVTSDSRSEYKWPGIPKIRRTRNLIFVFISTQLGHIVPVRAFATSDEADKFFDYVSDLSIKAKRANLK